MGKIVIRKEWKHIISHQQYYRIRNELERFLTPDRQHTTAGYLVRSLYFDTLDMKDLQENLDGVMDKCKLRLRTYPGNDEIFKLEVKCKSGTDSTKRFLVLTKEEAEDIVSLNSSFLLTKDNPLATECYQRLHSKGYLPALLVEYRREAYESTYEHTRITYDTQIRASRIKKDFFSDHPVGQPVLAPGKGILEVKYDSELPEYLARIVRRIDSRPSAYSKYVQGQLECQP